MTITRRSLGEDVFWYISHALVHGMVVELGTTERSLEVDELMGREPGQSLAEFGLCHKVQCYDLTCQCNRSDWRHSCNESQLISSTTLAEQTHEDGMLW